MKYPVIAIILLLAASSPAYAQCCMSADQQDYEAHQADRAQQEAQDAQRAERDRETQERGERDVEQMHSHDN